MMYLPIETELLSWVLEIKGVFFRSVESQPLEKFLFDLNVGAGIDFSGDGGASYLNMVSSNTFLALLSLTSYDTYILWSFMLFFFNIFGLLVNGSLVSFSIKYGFLN